MAGSKFKVGSLSSHHDIVKAKKQQGASSTTPLSSSQMHGAKTPKSSEFMQDTSSDEVSDNSDSGDDFDLEAERKKNMDKFLSATKINSQEVNGSKPTANKSKIAKSPPPSDSSSESGSGSEAEPSKSAVKAPESTAQSKQQVASGNDNDGSSEASTESETSDDDDIPAVITSTPKATTKKPAANAQTVTNGVPLNGKKSKGEASESDNSSSNGSEPDNDSGAKIKDPKQAKGKQLAVAQIAEDGHESDGSSSGSSGEAQRRELAKINNTNFVLRKASSENPGKEVADFFNKTNLEGKQVWYFTAPASLPITVLKDMEIDLEKARSGHNLLTHQGDDYGLELEPYATSTQFQLLIPSQRGDKYTSLNRAIDSTVHVQRVVKFGPDGTTDGTVGRDYVPPPKAIREQPQGLKSRFTPYGIPNPTPQQTIREQELPINAAPDSQATTVTLSPKKKKPKPSAPSKTNSSSESDAEMTPAPQPVLPPAPTAASIPVKSNQKRKRIGDEQTPIQSVEPSSKRPKMAKHYFSNDIPKTTFTTASSSQKTPSKPSSFKETPIHAPTIAQRMASISSDTPSLEPNPLTEMMPPPVPVSTKPDKEDKKDKHKKDKKDKHKKDEKVKIKKEEVEKSEKSKKSKRSAEPGKPEQPVTAQPIKKASKVPEGIKRTPVPLPQLAYK